MEGTYAGGGRMGRIGRGVEGATAIKRIVFLYVQATDCVCAAATIQNRIGTLDRWWGHKTVYIAEGVTRHCRSGEVRLIDRPNGQGVCCSSLSTTAATVAL